LIDLETGFGKGRIPKFWAHIGCTISSQAFPSPACKSFDAVGPGCRVVFWFVRCATFVGWRLCAEAGSRGAGRVLSLSRYFLAAPGADGMLMAKERT